VINGIVVHNNELLEDGQEVEAKGIEFCKQLYGFETQWVQTSYNNNFRKNYAGIGYSYDPTADAFIAPQPYASWLLNTTNYQWQAPVPYPEDGNAYKWNEEIINWVEM